MSDHLATAMSDHSVAAMSNLEIRRERIRSLTTVLRVFKMQSAPVSRSHDNHSLLRHFVNLLTRGDEDDKEARKVIAVAGLIKGDQRVQQLLIAQNRNEGEGLLQERNEGLSKEKLSLKLVEKVSDSRKVIAVAGLIRETNACRDLLLRIVTKGRGYSRNGTKDCLRRSSL